MNTTIRGHNLRVTVLIALMAVLVLMAVALVYGMRWRLDGRRPRCRPCPTRDERRQCPRVDDYRNPYIARHAEVVQRLGGTAFTRRLEGINASPLGGPGLGAPARGRVHRKER